MGHPGPTGGLLDRLRELVGPAHVRTDPAVTGSYLTDWTGRYRGHARCVVQPADTREVAGVVAACAAAGVPMVVQGGNTGLVGGATPMAGEVLLSLVRLTDLGPVDRVSGQVVAGAGVRLAVLQEHARAAGFEFGVDLGARGSATLGGLVATNAGGNHVLRYGTARAQVVGLEAVLPDGAVVTRMAGLPKDNTGYDLVSLLAGSEGTLAVITKLRLRLWPLAPARAVALVGLADTTACLALARVLRDQVPSLAAMELFHRDGLELVRTQAGLPHPLPGPPDAALLLVECAGWADPTEELMAALAAAGAENATIATDARTRARLWEYRERIPEAVAATGPVVKLDVAVPLDALVTAAGEIQAAVGEAAPGARAVLFGHLNEGNLHVNVVGAQGREEPVTARVLEVVAARGGSISAEHGIGRAKSRFLPLTRTAPDIAVMRRVKQAFDPHGLLNPGVIFGPGLVGAPTGQPDG
ncbi:MAG TPA: FAD-binding oxidoreductase [Natronosporangium sp.]|nr:FAD-binding oxidoreductase [Natronosporangium sp.]